MIMIVLLTGTLFYTYTENYNRSFSPTGFPIEEEARENIYDQPHTSSKQCTSPPPPGPEYYNYSAIRNQQAQQTLEASAVVLVPPSAARTVSAKPTPPPKPKQFTKDYNHRGRSIRHGIHRSLHYIIPLHTLFYVIHSHFRRS